MGTDEVDSGVSQTHRGLDERGRAAFTPTDRRDGAAAVVGPAMVSSSSTL